MFGPLVGRFPACWSHSLRYHASNNRLTSEAATLLMSTSIPCEYGKRRTCPSSSTLLTPASDTVTNGVLFGRPKIPDRDAVLGRLEVHRPEVHFTAR